MAAEDNRELNCFWSGNSVCSLRYVAGKGAPLFIESNAKFACTVEREPPSQLSTIPEYAKNKNDHAFPPNPPFVYASSRSERFFPTDRKTAGRNLSTSSRTWTPFYRTQVINPARSSRSVPTNSRKTRELACNLRVARMHGTGPIVDLSSTSFKHFEKVSNDFTNDNRGKTKKNDDDARKCVKFLEISIGINGQRYKTPINV